MLNSVGVDLTQSRGAVMAKILYTIIQISDCHLFSDKKQSLLSVKTYESLSAIVALIQLKQPEAEIIIVSGDISQDDSPQSYENFIEIMKSLNVSMNAVPGNHDNSTMMKILFPIKSIILESWQIILLNSQKPHFVKGFLDEDELKFLENKLASHSNLFSIIFFHHQPIRVDSVWLDKIGLSNSEDFWERLTSFPNVKAVFFGHVHQEFIGKNKNVPCYGAPSTCFQFKANHNDFALENIPPGFRWIDLYDDGTIKTGITRLDRYIGIFEKDAKGYE